MCCYNPCCSISASVFTIIQCSFHLATCIWMILINLCDVSLLNGNYFEGLLYLTYFYRNSCTTSNISSVIDTDDYYTLPDKSDKADMTYSFVMAFTALDSVWIISSFILIVGTCTKPSGWRYKVYHLPWLICCFTICAFDAFAAVIYGQHVTETNTLEKWFQFIGAKNNTIPDGVEIAYSYEQYLMVPSLAMSIIFSRFVIIWLVNVIFFLSVLCSVCKSPPDRKGRIHAPPHHRPVQYNIPQNADTPRMPLNYKTEPAQVREENNVYSSVHPKSNHPDISFKKPLPNIKPRTSSEDCTSNEARIKKWQLYYGSDAFDLRVKQPRPSNASLPPTAPPKEAPGYRTMMQPEGRSSYGEEALRSQLPWSYFRKRNDTGLPRSSIPEVMPPVPVPDYTFKFGEHRERKRL